MNNKFEEIKQTFEQNKKLLETQDFSKDIYQSQSDISLSLNPQKVEDTYIYLNNTISEYSKHRPYIEKGLKNLNEYVLDRDLDYFLLKAVDAYRLREIFEYYELTAPEWLPKTWRVLSENSVHRYTFLYNWATVDPSTINPKYHGFFILRLNKEIKPAPLRTTIGNALSEEAISELQNTKFPEQRSNLSLTAEESKSATEENASEAADVTESVGDTDFTFGVDKGHGKRDEFSLFVCRKYMSLDRSATKRGLDFTLNLADLESLLRNPICHFTNETLVHFPQTREEYQNNELPDNYLTIDRLDSDKGYIRGNVVVCGKAINELKNRMSHDEFESAVNMHKLLKSMNLSKEQLSLVAAMSN
ncbi:hypothetical protein [Vibrio sp. D431a]|uniref:hypothetical protein n=1 Tax=Vibrio sp. D431a TaxID=2837388 RepID=UPI0025523E05|nr:hypothetical protein [Vibrio sp. D431a]MDK9790091.1 hypothetical protein [Vibrio sp. D431a]